MLTSALTILGSLALLMYGMKTMSEGLQKMAGGGLRRVLGAMTTNRVTGVLTGAFVTAAVQSSTATTVMTVSFVNAGLLTLVQAISVIMGANIGTTLTAWIMAAGMGGFSTAMLVFPGFVVAILLSFGKTNGRKSFGEFVFGMCFLFLALSTLKNTADGMHLGENPAVLEFFANTGRWGFASTLLFLLLGGLLTFCVQSSAAIMAITMILCSSGALPIYQGIALVLGENIGTTITSNIAALNANRQARCAAMAHLCFNVFGVIWVLAVFGFFVRTVCGLVGYDADLAAADASYARAQAPLLNYVLPAFHTCFNLCNTLILIWFINPLARLVQRIIPAGKDEEDDFRLRFVSGGLMGTPELSVLEARKEIGVFAARCQKMFELVKELLHTDKTEDFTRLFSRIEKYESITDNMELEIANYLNRVSEGHLSLDTKTQIQMMLREVSELESIGDANYNLARSMNRRRQYAHDETFTDEQIQHIENMMALVTNALRQMMIVVQREENQRVDFNISYNIENEINNYRNQLKNQNLVDINEKKYDYQLGVFYIDIIAECEKLGDYIINVIQATMDRSK